MNKTLLNLTIVTSRNCYELDSPIPVTITIKNQSSEPLCLNKRMGVAYQDSLIRELYFSVYDAKLKLMLSVPDDMLVDVDRRLPKKSDFQMLNPGEFVAVESDLTHWFPFDQKGIYRIVFTYDNEFDGGEFGLSAFVGKIDSNPIDIVIA